MRVRRTHDHEEIAADGKICPRCGSAKVKRRGYHTTRRGRQQRFKCMCGKSFTTPNDIVVDGIALSGRYRTESITQISKLVKAGGSTRGIGSELGVSKATVMRIRRDVISQIGTIYCACGKVAGHNGWCGHLIEKRGSPPWQSQLKDINSLNFYIPSRPRYERPDIPNERETEIQLLVNHRHILSLEAQILGSPLGYDAASLHNFVPSDELNPLEALIQKEEFASAECQDRIYRLEQYRRWCERKSSAFQGIILNPLRELHMKEDCARGHSQPP